MSNPYGHFDDPNREYVITRPDTPLPWLNFLGQDEYFALNTNTAGGYSFYKDARLRRLTRYRYNEMPYDNNGRYLFIKDGDTVWNPGWKPVKTELDAYECRHGLGYSRITSAKDGLEASVLIFVPPKENLEIWQTTLTNKTDAPKTFKLFSFVEFCLYDAQNDATNFQRTYSIGEVEIEDNAIYHKTEYRERRDHYTMFACTRDLDGYDTSRDDFVGVHNGIHEPKAVLAGKPNNTQAFGWNPIGSHYHEITLQPGESTTHSYILAYVTVKGEKYVAPHVINKAPAKAILDKYADNAAVDAAFAKLNSIWDKQLSVFQVETPCPIMNRMGNAWNQAQCMATFNLSRSASLFESGIGRGMGYRDSNQDLLGFVHMVPDKARQRILDISATQMSSGLCFHQYQPLTKKGNSDIGGGFMDDHLWLILSTTAYIRETGDVGILDEKVGYADVEEKTATLMDHLELSIQYTLENRGPHNLPLIGHADWNDCLNLNCFSTEPNESFQTASHNTKEEVAESLMIAGLFLKACLDLEGLYKHLGADEKAKETAAAHAEMLEAVETQGWDGEWYLRAYDTYKEPIGSKKNEEGSIYIESQGWLVMGGAGRENGRAQQTLDSVHTHLFTEDGCVLQQPPYQTYHLHLGEVSSYPPGYKENAGIFCHNNPWIHLAHMELGNGDRAYEYYLSVCPAAKEDKIEVYRGEPYMYSQMIAGKDAATPGEAKNAGLTGTAAWTFLTISQGFAGIKPDYTGLKIDPCLPTSWPEIKVTRKFRGKTFNITIQNPDKKCKGIKSLTINGKAIEGDTIPLTAASDVNEVVAVIG
ncbi:hypothetical protein [Pelagicoccus sp. SDUM812003]|uniref:GH36-type glycosyl hydrolase domain-containing protein n=1 Tax=Pelagicoccus sp. SDUM812003 TaxID=3041267 RepID=UPI00280D5910|nr:hypothetical protein [Pelagicoccus sp. SDUM812003]MDQ8205688.1 hypothetical protein [Pelagicoccus sp. SDUM812003]